MWRLLTTDYGLRTGANDTMLSECDIGVVGLGVMGRNLALNLADHGFAAAGLDTDAGKARALEREGGGRRVAGVTDPRAFIGLLRRPRAALLLVPAKAVDAAIAELRPFLSAGDLIIDAGNSHFVDTDRRGRELAAQNLMFLGMGVSGGEAGARHGPSLMPGGPAAAYARVEPMLEAVAARVQGEPCVAHLGPGSAGHYVKMVHNGIEYGLMQLIAETYDLMRRGLRMTNDEMQAVYDEWQQSGANSFLLEITAQIFRKRDPKTGAYLLDVIRDVAGQKGTGKWTSQSAMDLQTPIPTIDAAVSMRDLSALGEERVRAERLLPGPSATFRGGRPPFLGELHDAFHAAMILTYVQGFARLRRASTAMNYGLDLATVARIWRGGCIIRAAILEPFRAACAEQPNVVNLLLHPGIAGRVAAGHIALRAVVATGVRLGVPVAGFSASLAYYDAFRSSRLPTNLIQAQRDFFGAHTYERIDEPGTFHTEW